MVRKILGVLTILALALAGVAGWQLYQTKQALERGEIEAEMREALGLAEGVETLADRVLTTLGAEWEGIHESPELWGLAEGGDLPTTLDEERAVESLHPSRKMRKFFLERMPPGLEAPGQEAILQRQLDLRQQRGMSVRLAEDMLSLLVLGRVSEALGVYEAGHRHARIMGRGLGGRPSLITKMVEAAQHRVLDRAMAHALRYRMVPGPSLEEVAKIARDAEARLQDLDRAAEAEFAAIETLVDILDRRLGPLAWVLRLYWGDGHAQVDQVRQAWKAGEPPPEELLRGGHLMVRIGVPNWAAARRRWSEVATWHRGVQLAARLEAYRYQRDEYPPLLPDDAVDPSCGEPFQFEPADDSATLYAFGADGKDDGGDPEEDVVILLPR